MQLGLGQLVSSRELNHELLIRQRRISLRRITPVAPDLSHSESHCRGRDGNCDVEGEGYRADEIIVRRQLYPAGRRRPRNYVSLQSSRVARWVSEATLVIDSRERTPQHVWESGLAWLHGVQFDIPLESHLRPANEPRPQQTLIDSIPIGDPEVCDSVIRRLGKLGKVDPVDNGVSVAWIRMIVRVAPHPKGDMVRAAFGLLCIAEASGR